MNEYVARLNSRADHPRGVLINVAVLLEAKEAEQLAPEGDRWVQEAGLVGVDNGPLVDEVSLAGPDERGAPEEFPEDEEHDSHDDHRIVREEVVHAPRCEGAVAIEDEYQGLEGEREVCAVRLEPAPVGERPAVDALRLARFVEEDVGGRHDDVVDDAAGSDEIDEPCQHGRRAARNLQKGQKGEAHDDGEGSNGHAIPCCLSQNLRSTALEGQAI